MPPNRHASVYGWIPSQEFAIWSDYLGVALSVGESAKDPTLHLKFLVGRRDSLSSLRDLRQRRRTRDLLNPMPVARVHWRPLAQRQLRGQENGTAGTVPLSFYLSRDRWCDGPPV